MANKIDYFCSDTIRKDLKGKTVRGGVFTAAAQVVKVVVGLATIPILARLLDPEDFGLVAMVTVFTGLAALFVDSGLSMATVQRADLTHKQSSSLFWIASILGLLMCLIVGAASPVVAWFYQEPRLIPITLAIASSYLFTGLSIQHLALLRRTMQFQHLNAATIASLLVAQGAAIAWAWAWHNTPYDYWALVLIPILTALVNMAYAWWACGWMPSPPRFDRSVLPLLNYGVNFSGSQFVNYFSRNGDNMLIGWYWGEVSLGYYERSYKLLLYPLRLIHQPLTQIAVPALSRLTENPDAYRRTFRSGVQVFGDLQIPIVFAILALAEPLVLTLLGPGWEDCVLIFIALWPAALVSTTAPASSWVYLSWGHTDQLLRLTIVSSVLVVIGFLIATPFGPAAVAASYSTVMCLIRLPNIYYAFKPTPLKMRDMFEPITLPIFASGAAAFAVLFARPWLTQLRQPPEQLVAGLAVFSLAYVAAFSATAAGRAHLRWLFTMVHQHASPFDKQGGAV